MSLTWIVGPFWDDFPVKTMIPGLGRDVRSLYFYPGTWYPQKLHALPPKSLSPTSHLLKSLLLNGRNSLWHVERSVQLEVENHSQNDIVGLWRLKEDNGWSPKIMEVSEKHIFLVGIFAVEWGKSQFDSMWLRLALRCATIGDPDRSRHFDTILEVWIIPSQSHEDCGSDPETNAAAENFPHDTTASGC